MTIETIEQEFFKLSIAEQMDIITKAMNRIAGLAEREETVWGEDAVYLEKVETELNSRIDAYTTGEMKSYTLEEVKTASQELRRKIGKAKK